MTRGLHLIAGEWVDAPASFENAPASGDPATFAAGTPELIDRACRACRAAEAPFADYAAITRAERAAFLRAIADEIEARTDELTAIGIAETGLPAGRPDGERGRTTGQLRLFVDHIEDGAHLDRRHDAALPDRAPLPRPDLKMVQRPVGPVAVFGASNFPLAFSTAGGDTASALAAGCPVVVKGHEAHPGTAQVVAEAILAAIRGRDMPPGVFAMVHCGSREEGRALVTHPLIRAVGFTGSLGAGRALYDLCAARPGPIPFFGELVSVNSVFVLPAAAAARGEEIARGWIGSLTLGAGRFCTNPGLVIVPGSAADAFVDAARAAAADAGPQTMLTDGIADAYRAGRDRLAAKGGAVVTSGAPGRNAAPDVVRIDADALLADPALTEEVFGPFGLIVDTPADRMAEVARALHGQLTATLQMDEADLDLAATLVPVLERKAGRLLVNDFPTGVKVSGAMVHGGPYPASTNFGATSVGTLAIRRFLRPVRYQDMPEALLPADLRKAARARTRRGPAPGQAGERAAIRDGPGGSLRCGDHADRSSLAAWNPQRARAGRKRRTAACPRLAESAWHRAGWTGDRAGGPSIPRSSLRDPRLLRRGMPYRTAVSNEPSSSEPPSSTID